MARARVSRQLTPRAVHGKEFHKIDSDTLMKALQALEKDGKCQIFAGSSADNLGVKFFGP